MRYLRYLLFTIMFLIFSYNLVFASTGDNSTSVKLNSYYENYKEILNEAEIKGINYNEYLKEHDTKLRPNVKYEIDAKDYINTDGMQVKEYANYKGMGGISIYTGEKGYIDYNVNIEEEGFYDISIVYYPIEGTGGPIQRAIFVDSSLPYKELGLVEFQRIYVNATNKWQRDNRGNDIIPEQKEKPDWITSYCYDSEGYVTENLSLYLTKGVHKITLYSIREPMLLHKIILDNSSKVLPYSEVIKNLDGKGIKDTLNQEIRIEAEDANKKSSPMLHPTQDKSSPAVYPYSPKELKNNTVGSDGNWSIVGQWLEWDFNVPESGYYYITMNVRQNFVRGIYTSRKITIDGKVPFEEMNSYGFTYNSQWHMVTLENSKGEKYKFYLEAGKHTIRMEVVLGNFGNIVSQVQGVMQELNSTYRKVIRITGVDPDSYRDYNIEQNIPELDKELIDERNKLNAAIKDLQKVAGTGSDREAALSTMVADLNYVIPDVERLPAILGAFKMDISALGTWITGVVNQPLAVDTIYIHSPNVKITERNNSIWNRFVHEVKSLYYSFVIDYNAIGNVAKGGRGTRTITVWIGSGRDQANVLKKLIDETFTPKTNINVNVMLVDMNMLLPATLAGQGPDVAVQVATDLPMNYGLRNAVVDLKKFRDIADVKKQFRESAMVPYEFGGHTFALPETQTWPMMFYRKDILDELGLKVPETWDEMESALSVLSKNQMDLGMLPDENIFAMLLYQNGGKYYNSDATSSELDSDVAVKAFKEYCKFYTDYKLDTQNPVDQRFRTGEAPIVIADYTLYNQLQVSAPDIKGLWGFSMVPGTVTKDGKIDYSVGSTGTATIMLKQTKNEEASWEFMKWWVSTDTQIKYSQELEALMGAAARYPTANIKAFESLPWPSDDYDALKSQAEWVKGIPQIPGSYFTWRNINNAFYTVVFAENNNKMEPREALTEYVRYINDEITFKRQEFGLSIPKK